MNLAGRHRTDYRVPSTVRVRDRERGDREIITLKSMCRFSLPLCVCLLCGCRWFIFSNKPLSPNYICAHGRWGLWATCPWGACGLRGHCNMQMARHPLFSYYYFPQCGRRARCRDHLPRSLEITCRPPPPPPPWSPRAVACLSRRRAPAGLGSGSGSGSGLASGLGLGLG